MNIHIKSCKSHRLSLPGTFIPACCRMLCLVLLGAFIASCTTDSGMSIRLENTLTIERPSEPVVIKRESLGEWLATGAAGQKIVVRDEAGQAIPSQLDDLDADGNWDELSFQYSLPAQSKVAVKLEWLEPGANVTYDPRAHAYLGHRPTREGNFQSVDQNIRPKDHEPQSQPYLYQFEGPGWESDVIAYRMYFDRRNGKDIFGKTKTGIFLESIGVGENYHKLQDWGMDVLKVGNSLGAGSLAMLKNDSIYRLGETQSSEFKKIADGPVRAIIRLSYTGWEVEGKSYDLEEVITIWGGKRWYYDKVTLKGSSADTLITGLVNLFDIQPVEKTFSNFTILASHGKQSENQDMLGMALLAPSDRVAKVGSAPKEGEGVTFTEYMALKGAGSEYHYWFYTGWELEDEKFASQQQFMNALEEEASKLSEPIRITINLK
ncbi:MAG: DUF4861 domain-containing protein [Cytophagales bacterium]|nr:DUF4861 domain-containing protein [Cytophagales bacterium]